MDLMQLRMLLAVADGKSLQRAGLTVGRTPQAVSMAIDKLEKQLGLALLQAAAGKGLTLTPAGEALADSARRALSLLDEGVSAAKEIACGQRGALHIGANQSIGEHVLPRVTDLFHKRYPDVKLKVTIEYTDTVLASLSRGEMDIALVAHAAREAHLTSTLLMKDRVVAVMSTHHALAAADGLGIADLASQSLILLSEPSELNERVVETFRRFQVSMNPCVMTSTLESIKRMAAQNVGIGIVPRLCVGQEPKLAGLAVKTIAEFGDDRELWMVCPSDPSPACRGLCAIIEDLYGTGRPRIAPASLAAE